MHEKLTEKEANRMMKERGFERTAEIESIKEGKICCYLKLSSELNASLHAKVYLNSESVDLSFGQLKFMCYLNTGKFDFFHKDFEKFEKSITVYAALCVGENVLKIIDNLKQEQAPTKTEEEKPKIAKKDIATRKKEFWNEIMPIAKQRSWTKDQALKFYEYWTETSKGGQRFRRENETYFDINKRMATFDRIDNEKVAKNKTFLDQKTEKQNKELKTKTVNKKDLF